MRKHIIIFLFQSGCQALLIPQTRLPTHTKAKEHHKRPTPALNCPKMNVLGHEIKTHIGGKQTNEAVETVHYAARRRETLFRAERSNIRRGALVTAATSGLNFRRQRHQPSILARKGKSEIRPPCYCAAMRVGAF